MKTRFQSLCIAGLCVTLLSSIGASIAQAETVAYWRFENLPGFLKDSENNMDLTAVNGGGGGPVQYTLPATGAGSTFPDPVPQTGQSNDYGARMLNTYDGFTGADHSKLHFTDGFTIELFFNKGDVANHKIVFMQYDYGNNDRALYLSLPKTGIGTSLKLVMSNNGVDTETFYAHDIDMSLVYLSDKDYYGAVTVDLSTKEVTFYMKNLTDGGELLKGTTSCILSALHDASSPFFVGPYYGTGGGTTSDVFDEVRISNVALSESELLINIPEPSTLALLATGLIGLLAYAWRKRK